MNWPVLVSSRIEAVLGWILLQVLSSLQVVVLNSYSQGGVRISCLYYVEMPKKDLSSNQLNKDIILIVSKP